MKKEMKVWDGLECDWETHASYVDRVFDYMSKNKKDTYYYVASGDTFVVGFRDSKAKDFEIYDLIIRRHGIFKDK